MIATHELRSASWMALVAVISAGALLGLSSLPRAIPSQCPISMAEGHLSVHHASHAARVASPSRLWRSAILGLLGAWTRMDRFYY